MTSDKVSRRQPLGGPRVRPVLALLSAFSRMMPSAEPAVRRTLTWTWYQLISLWSRPGEAMFMNYGYAPFGGGTGVAQSPDTYSALLYQRVAGAVDLRDSDVLDIGCGRGAGSSFILTNLGARSVTGVDFAARAIAFCKNYYRTPGLSFWRGDAEDLPFPDESFDTVVNVESSHAYGSMERFLAEVERVLRPGGYFLFADLRESALVPTLRDVLKRTGMTTQDEENISENVVRSLELGSEGKLALLQRVPGPVRAGVKEFTAIPGTPVYEMLRTGELQYLRYVLQKPLPEPS